MPTPMIIAKVTLEVKIQWLKAWIGMIGSLALRSTSTNSAASTTGGTSSPMPVAESQPTLGALPS